MIMGALAGYLTFVELTDVTPVPTSETNWIMTRTATASNGINMVSDIRYFNGLGLPVQDVSVKYTPQGNDLVAPVEYDGILRDDARSYLPYPATGGNGAFRANALSAQAQYYQLTFGSEGTRAYSVKEYDPSPLNRVRRTAGPGRLTTDGSVKYVSFEYLGNSSSEVLRLQVNDAGTTLTANGYYPQNTLFKTRAQDEDGNHTEVFTDQEGRTLLSRAFDAAGSRVDTYSVYDDAGRLRWVVAPACSATLGTTTTLTQDSSPARDYCYVYRYDDRGNVIEKRLPGKSVECYVYDHADRPVLFQDSLLRESGRWRMISYDPLDRESSRQLIGNPSNRSVLAAWVESGGDPAQHDESSSTQLESEAFYSASRIPSKLAFSAVAGTVQSADTAISSQIRYNRSLVLDGAETDTYEESAYYYDAKGRLVQTVTLNCMGGIDRRSARYDFVGNVLAVVESHRAGPAATEEVMTGLFTYDSRNRLIAQTMSLNGATSASVTYTYDELGRLAGRHFGQGDTAIADNLTYNIRGWLTQQANPQFSMSLRYYDPQQTATTPSYTGNISEWSWQQGNAGNANTYAFTYDGLARLTGAKQYVDGDADDRFVEKGLTYDRNGNLLSMQRTQNGTIADNLTYTYTGNQLTALSGTTAATYTYDGNGNMIHDGANNLNIAYNRLNLIEKAIRNDVVLAKYSYLSDGTKLSATDAAGDGLYYAGSLVYRKQNGAFALEGAAFSGGRFVATNAGVETHYHLTDHLGSVRAIVNGLGEVVERNDYYPFGMRWNDAAVQTSDNRYRYNGKENQDFVNVPYLDYGARMYDPRFSVRWNGPDLLAEKYCPISPYAFCANNPLKYVDLTGKAWAFYSIDGKEEPTWNWVDGDVYRTGIMDDFGNEIVLPAYDAVVVFHGSLEESLGEDGTLTGQGAKAADVTIYGINEQNDIRHYRGLTVSSNPNIYPMIAEGDYLAYHEQMPTSVYARNALTYRITTMRGELLIPPVDGINKRTGKTYIEGEYFHRTDWNGVARKASQACLVIDGRQWREVERQIGKSNNIFIRVSR